MDRLPKIEIRNDDVLIHKGLTQSMRNGTRKKTFYEWFLEVDQWFDERHIPVILAVLADGIDVHPEWVQYIKNHQDRFSVELHGHTHVNYRSMTKDEARPLVKEAVKKIEDTFGTKITTWYFPFYRQYGFPDWGIDLCDELGLRFNTKDNPIRHFYFHYWNTRSVRNIKKVIERIWPQIRETK